MPTERETPSTQISDIPALLPLDDYHRQLQRNAHPTDWVPPTQRALQPRGYRCRDRRTGSGVGTSVCANKVTGIRAALIHDHFSARQGV